MEVSGQRHASAAPPPDKGPLPFYKEDKSFDPTGIRTDLSARIIANVLPELS